MINSCASCLWHPPTHNFCCLSYYPCTQKGGLDTWKCITLSEVSVWIITKAAFNVQGGNQAEPLMQFYSVRVYLLDIRPLEWSRGVTGYNVSICAIPPNAMKAVLINHWQRTFAISYHYHHPTSNKALVDRKGAMAILQLLLFLSIRPYRKVNMITLILIQWK